MNLLGGNYEKKKIRQKYKQETVQLVNQSDTPISEIARNLGINDNVLRRWVKEQADPNKRLFPGHGHARDEEIAPP